MSIDIILIVILYIKIGISLKLYKFNNENNRLLICASNFDCIDWSSRLVLSVTFIPFRKVAK